MSIPVLSGIKAPSKSTPKPSRTSFGRSESQASVSRSSSVSTLASVAEGRDGLEEKAIDFSIGDRVWVNGSKPGTVQYIGKTDFAPGVWAGIALDEAVGKNNGTINDITYFVCEPLKGIFIRPHRLTKEAGSPPTLAGDSTSKMRDNGSVRSLLTKPPTSPRNALTSPSRHSCSKLRVGDRVVVSSVSGQKFGILRYLGTTEFASGEWAGIELDSPIGKNDGSVGGKRYFTCAMKHGLFAPVSKVSRETGSLSQTPSIAGSFRNRSYSRESLNSSVSSVASSKAGKVKLGVTSLGQKSPKSPKSPSGTPTLAQVALQDALKEKQEHIEQLLKERDLDREEVVKAANQVEKVEKQLNSCQQKYESAMQENAKMIFLKEQFDKIDSEKKQLFSLLDEEKRKIEDLQFRLEEEMILKSDLEAQVDKEKAKIKELESLNLTASKDVTNEVVALKTSLQEYKSKINENQMEVETLREKLQKKEKELTDVSNELERQCNLIESSKTELKKEMQNLKEVKDAIVKETAEKEQYFKGEIEKLINEKKEIQDKNHDFAKDIKSQNDTISALQTQLEDSKKKIDILSKGSSDQVAELHKRISELELQLEHSKTEAKEKELQFSVQVTNTSQEKQTLENEINNLKNTCENKSKELEKLKLELEESKKENHALSQGSEQATSLLQGKVNEIKKQLETLETDSNKKEQNLKTEIETLSKEEKQFKTIIQELQENLEIKNGEISRLKMELQNASKSEAEKVKELQSEISAHKMTTEIIIKEKTEKDQSFKAEIETLVKEKKQSEIAKLEFLQNLKVKDEELNKLKLDLQEAKSKAANVDELQVKISNMEKKMEILNLEKEQLLKTMSSEKEQIYGMLSEKEKLLKDQLMEAQSSLNAALEDKKKVVQNMESQIKELTLLHQNTQNESREKQSEISKLKSSLDEKENQITELAGLVKHSQDQLEQLKTQNNNNVTLLENRIAEFKEQQEKHLLEKEKKLNEEIERLNHCLSEKESNYLKILSNFNELKTKDKKQEEEIQKIQQKLKDTDDERKSVVATYLSEKDEFMKQLLAVKSENDQLKLKKKEETQEEIKHLNALLEKKNEEVKSKVEEIENSNLQIKSQKEELQKVQLLLKDTDEKDAKLTFEKSQKEMVEKQLETLKSEYNKLKVNNEETVQQMKIAQASCQELEKFKENLIQKNVTQEAAISEREQKLNALQFEIERMQRNFSEHKETLQKKLDISEKEKNAMNEFKTQLDLQHSVFEELQQRLEESEKAKVLLSAQLENKFKEEKKELEDKMSELQMMLNKTETKLSDKENANDSFKKQLESKDLLLELQNEEIEKLKTITSKYDSEKIVVLKEQVSKLQEENIKLSENLTTLKNVPEDGAALTIEEQNALKESLQEKISQVNFLNSIIVDMKKKNAELTEQLESPNLEKDLNLNGIKAPRFFCDICDVFDLHDTEDCPKQCTSVEDEVPHSKHNGKRKEERPYCYNCEIFGHWTIDCDQEETF